MKKGTRILILFVVGCLTIAVAGMVLPTIADGFAGNGPVLQQVQKNQVLENEHRRLVNESDKAAKTHKKR